MVSLSSFDQYLSIDTLFIIIFTMKDRLNSFMFINLRHFQHVSLFRTLKCLRKTKRIGEMEENSDLKNNNYCG